MSLRISGDGDPADSVGLEYPGADQLQARLERPLRIVTVARQHQRAVHSSFGREPLHRPLERGLTPKITRDDVRHRPQSQFVKPDRDSQLSVAAVLWEARNIDRCLGPHQLGSRVERLSVGRGHLGRVACEPCVGDLGRSPLRQRARLSEESRRVQAAHFL
jgi:hypothetical protein